MSWNLREGIKQALLANTALAALVGDRVSSSFAPFTGGNAVGPWIVMSKLHGGEETAMDGDNGLSHPLFQFTIGGTDKEAVDEAQRLLIDFNGTEFTYVENGSRTLTFLHKDDRDAWDDSVHTYRVAVDLEVWANK